jgi:hypothetical protein
MKLIEKIGKGLGVVFVFIFMTSLLGIIMAWPTQLLWNWLMPELFALKTITFFQAWGINALTSFLFKSTVSSSDKK